MITLVVLSCVRMRWKPQECTTVENVSGLYGPGAYWAWILTTISAMFTTFSADQDKIVSIDFIGSFLYALAAIGDLQLRVCLECHADNRDLQYKASLHIMGVSNLFCLLALVLGELRYSTTVLASYQWQLWKAFQLAPYFQVTLWLYWVATGNISWTLVFSTFHISPLGWLRTSNRGDGGLRCIRYGYISVFILSCVTGQEPVGKLSGLPFFPPLSGAKLSDMDQALTLVTAILALTVQWKAWRCIPWLASRQKERDQGSNENRDEHYVLPVIATSTR